MRRIIMLIPLLFALVAAVFGLTKAIEGAWLWASLDLAISVVMTVVGLTTRKWLRQADASQVAR